MTKTLLIAILCAGLSAAASVQYLYDAAGRLIKVDYGDGGSIAYAYDNAGNLLSRTVTLPPKPSAQTGK